MAHPIPMFGQVTSWGFEPSHLRPRALLTQLPSLPLDFFKSLILKPYLGKPISSIHHSLAFLNWTISWNNQTPLQLN